MLDCEDCKWYWQNNDTGVECNGDSTPCDEFIDITDTEE